MEGEKQTEANMLVVQPVALCPEQHVESSVEENGVGKIPQAITELSETTEATISSSNDPVINGQSETIAKVDMEPGNMVVHHETAAPSMENGGLPYSTSDSLDTTDSVGTSPKISPASPEKTEMPSSFLKDHLLLPDESVQICSGKLQLPTFNSKSTENDTGNICTNSIKPNSEQNGSLTVNVETSQEKLNASCLEVSELNSVQISPSDKNWDPFTNAGVQSACKVGVNGTDVESSDSMMEVVTSEGCIMQRVVEGNLRPMAFDGTSAPSEPSLDTNLFVGLSESSLSQDVMPGLITGSSLNVVNTNECLNGSLDIDTQLTDLSTSSVQFTEIANAVPDLSSPFTLVTDSKPSFIKLLPLQNGHTGWTMDDLRASIAQNGSVFLKLSATPEAANSGSATPFTALFLDVCEVVEEASIICDRKRKISVDDEDNPLSPYLKKADMTAWPSLSPIQSDSSEMVASQPAFQQTSLPDSSVPNKVITSNSSVKMPSKQNVHIPLSPPKGKKRGRPPLHGQGDLIGQIPLEALSSVIDANAGSMSLPSLQNSIVGSMLTKKLKADKLSSDEQQLSPGYKRLLSLTCVQCGSIFRNKSGLASHVKSKHKVFKMCHTCNKKVHLQDKYSFKRHLLKTHRDKSQLTCFKCTVSFKVMLHLKRHDRVVHEDSESSGLSSCEIGSDSEREDDVKSPLPQKSEKDLVVEEGKKSTNHDVIEKKKLQEEKKENVICEDKISKPSRTKSGISGVGLPNDVTPSPELKESDESGNETDAEESDSESEPEEVEEKKKYFCKECDTGFSHKFKLNHHIQDKHTRNEASLDFEVDPENLVCNTCKKHCRTPKQFEQHLAQHERRGCLPESKQDDSSSDSKIPKNSRLKVLQQEANKIMGKPKKRGRPPRLPDSQESTVASDTKKNNEWPSYVSKKGRVFTCTKCSVSFSREKSMTYHLKKIHETLYPFRACPDCGKVFRSSGPYIRHMNQHKVKKCPVPGCKARYKNSRLIRKHQKSSHPEYPHRCSRCIQLYQKLSQLEKHKAEEHPQSESVAENAENSEDYSEDEEDQAETNQEPKTEIILSCKRPRKAPVSYKEVEEDEDLLGRKRRKFSHPKSVEKSSEHINPVPKVKKKPTPNRQIQSQQAKGTDSTQKSQSPPKRPKVNKLAYLKNKLYGVQFKKKGSENGPKKVTTSWTAALKAKYNFNKKGYSKKTDKNSPEKKPSIKAKNPSPVDVVRRVTESLLQQQKSSGVTNSEIPRQYSSLLHAKKNEKVDKKSNESLDSTPPKSGTEHGKEPEVDDGSVLRFDYF